MCIPLSEIYISLGGIQFYIGSEYFFTHTERNSSPSAGSIAVKENGGDGIERREERRSWYLCDRYE
jgi:hypothetical protein